MQEEGLIRGRRDPLRFRAVLGQEGVDVLKVTIDGEELELQAFTMGELQCQPGGLLEIPFTEEAAEAAHRRGGQVARVVVHIGQGGPRLPLQVVFLESWVDEGAGGAVVLPFLRLRAGEGASC